MLLKKRIYHGQACCVIIRLLISSSVPRMLPAGPLYFTCCTNVVSFLSPPYFAPRISLPGSSLSLQWILLQCSVATSRHVTWWAPPGQYALRSVVVLAEPGLVLLGLSPPTVAATAPQLLCLTLTVISHADFHGSNQATSVANTVTFKCRPERNAEHTLFFFLKSHH